MRLPAALVAATLAGLSAAAEAASPAECARTTTVYLPIETAMEPLGYRAESRSEYLDRRYGAGQWRMNGADLVRAVPGEPDAAVTIAIASRAESGASTIDLIAEAQLDYLDVAGRPGTVYAHRGIASYRLHPEGENRIGVPYPVFKEPGALLAVIEISSPDTRERRVAALPVVARDCERRVYVEDRFMAIRLNREARR